MDRFYVGSASDLAPGSKVRLGGPEAHHIRVRRLEPGDRVRLFDGRGREVVAEFTALERGTATLTVLAEEVAVAVAGPGVAVTIGLALPKGKRALILLEKATELGVAAIFPLVTRRAVGGARHPLGALTSQKWLRTTIEAAKQSGVRALPRLLPPCDLTDVLARASPEEADALRVILDPRPSARPLREVLARPRPASALVLVGPEGGFEDAEVEAAVAAGFERARLGATVLRIETAAIAALAAIVVAYE